MRRRSSSSVNEAGDRRDGDRSPLDIDVGDEVANEWHLVFGAGRGAYPKPVLGVTLDEGGDFTQHGAIAGDRGQPDELVWPELAFAQLSTLRHGDGQSMPAERLGRVAGVVPGEAKMNPLVGFADVVDYEVRSVWPGETGPSYEPIGIITLDTHGDVAPHAKGLADQPGENPFSRRIQRRP